VKFAACVSLLLLWSWSATAAARTNYYARAEGKCGAALHDIIKNHTSLPYSTNYFDTSDALKVLDEDPANTNNVILIYAQRSEPKTNFASVWNREHLWPNSYGLDDVQPAYSELRNLRAEDATVNSSRGNKFYDVSDPSNGSYRNPAHVEAPQCSTDSNSWEPPSGMKGDIARALFYMAVRYIGDHTNEPALCLTDRTNELSTATNLMGRLTTLLRWHEEDPVDAREETREEIIFTRFQHNRNPFVDHPEWVRPAFWPEMQIVRSNSVGTVSWRAEYSTAVLEFAFQSPTAAWNPIGGNRSTNNGKIVVDFTLPPGPEAGYLRLRLP
jgi:endonuclease I